MACTAADWSDFDLRFVLLSVVDHGLAIYLGLVHGDAGTARVRAIAVETIIPLIIVDVVTVAEPHIAHPVVAGILFPLNTLLETIFSFGNDLVVFGTQSVIHPLPPNIPNEAGAEYLGMTLGFSGRIARHMYLKASAQFE